MEKQEKVAVESDGSIAIGNVVSTINVNGGNYKANDLGVAYLPNMLGEGDLDGLVRAVTLNDTIHKPDTAGIVDLGTIESGGGSDIDVSKFVQSITVNGVTYVPASNGSVNLGTIGGGGGGTGTVKAVKFSGILYEPDSAGVVNIGQWSGIAGTYSEKAKDSCAVYVYQVDDHLAPTPGDLSNAFPNAYVPAVCMCLKGAYVGSGVMGWSAYKDDSGWHVV